MEWDKTRTRELRLRLGWTQSDLARRLQIQVQDIIEWELGKKNPNHGVVPEIEFLLKQAEICSEEVQLAPRIENELEHQHLNQVDVHQIYNKTPESEKN
ncbi:MAG TPA: helix-turn-helix domain-containing protein [Pseudobdellovibrionaceae bacterium]|nr:helix-turn-helix domain-containing protein [Pseudobdellovibrionaceae bacterium]